MQFKEKNLSSFLVSLDQQLTWKEYIKLTGNKIAKNIGILNKARPFFTPT